MAGRHLVRCALAALSLSVAGGCWAFERPPIYLQPEPPSEEMRANFGRVGLVVCPVELGRELDDPVSDWVDGLGVGASRGFLVMILSPWVGAGAGLMGGPYGAFGGAIVGTALGVIYFPVSTLAGAFGSLDPDDVAAWRAELEAGFEYFDFPAVMARQFRQLAATDAGVSVVDLGTLDSSVPADAAVQAYWTECDTVVCLDVVGLPNDGSVGILSLDKAFGITAVARLRVWQPGSAGPVYDSTLFYGRPVEEHRFAEWAAHRAELLIAYLRRGGDLLVERFVAEVFLRYAEGERSASLTWGAP